MAGTDRRGSPTTDGSPESPRRLLVVQYAGDYRETWRRLQAGGSETYFAQAYSDGQIARLATPPHQVAVVVGLTESAYEETLADGLVAVGLGGSSRVSEAAILAFALTFRPTHLLLRAPMPRVMHWAADHHVATLLTLADSFGSGMRAWLQTRRLVRLMNQPHVEWVGNHGVAASRGLVAMGVSPAKVVPWDWPHANSPAQWAPKILSAASGPRNLLYVGARIAPKGVGDAIQAVGLLAGRGIDIHLEVIGDGDSFVAQVQSLKIQNRITFRGRVANTHIIEAMRTADVVLVPSRHEYPEGFPLTIYEALCSRTPLVVSNHPMLIQKLAADRSAVVFTAGNVGDLAAAIERLLASPKLYNALSLAALATWQSLQVPMTWGELVTAWADGTTSGRAWVQEHAWSDRDYA